MDPPKEQEQKNEYLENHFAILSHPSPNTYLLQIAAPVFLHNLEPDENDSKEEEEDDVKKK